MEIRIKMNESVKNENEWIVNGKDDKLGEAMIEL